MSATLQALTARRIELQAECAAQREAVGRGFDSVEEGVRPVDRAIDTARRFAPLLAVAGVATLIVLGPRRTIRIARGAMTFALYATPALRFLR